MAPSNEVKLKSASARTHTKTFRKFTQSDFVIQWGDQEIPLEVHFWGSPTRYTIRLFLGSGGEEMPAEQKRAIDGIKYQLEVALNPAESPINSDCSVCILPQRTGTRAISITPKRSINIKGEGLSVQSILMTLLCKLNTLDTQDLLRPFECVETTLSTIVNIDIIPAIETSKEAYELSLRNGKPSGPPSPGVNDASVIGGSKMFDRYKKYTKETAIGYLENTLQYRLPAIMGLIKGENPLEVIEDFKNYVVCLLRMVKAAKENENFTALITLLEEKFKNPLREREGDGPTIEFTKIRVFIPETGVDAVAENIKLRTFIAKTYKALNLNFNKAPLITLINAVIEHEPIKDEEREPNKSVDAQVDLIELAATAFGNGEEPKKGKMKKKTPEPKNGKGKKKKPGPKETPKKERRRSSSASRLTAEADQVKIAKGAGAVPPPVAIPPELQAEISGPASASPGTQFADGLAAVVAGLGSSEKKQKAAEEAQKAKEEAEAERRRLEKLKDECHLKAAQKRFAENLERKHKEEAARVAKEAAEQKNREEAEAERLRQEKAEAERKAAEEAQKAEEERKTAEDAEARKAAKEEADQKAAELAEAERKTKAEADQKAAEAEAEAERQRQAEEAARIATELAEADRKATEEEAARIAAELAEADRKATEEDQKAEAERNEPLKELVTTFLNSMGEQKAAKQEAERLRQAEATQKAAEEAARALTEAKAIRQKDLEIRRLQEAARIRRLQEESDAKAREQLAESDSRTIEVARARLDAELEAAHQRLAGKRAAEENRRGMPEIQPASAVQQRAYGEDSFPGQSGRTRGARHSLERGAQEELSATIQDNARRLIDDATKAYLADLDRTEKRPFGFIKRKTRLSWFSVFNHHGERGLSTARTLRKKVGLPEDPNAKIREIADTSTPPTEALLEHFQLRKKKESLNPSSLDTCLLKGLVDNPDQKYAALKKHITGKLNDGDKPLYAAVKADRRTSRNKIIRALTPKPS